jgi:tRNA U34 5-methylaminomethyl-2-thiouridine-forming methyltransferase MnmC
MEQPTLIKIITEDNSLTCFHSETGELYHNRAGAFTEALKNYVEPALAVSDALKCGRLDVLDACFGLGYNTFVLLKELQNRGQACHVNVLALDNDAAILSLLPDVLQDARFDTLRHSTGAAFVDPHFGNYEFVLGEQGQLTVAIKLQQADLRAEVPCLTQSFDLIFHDAFSPSKVPELWTVDLFKKYFHLLRDRHGALLTYSAAPAVRAALRLAGFDIYATCPVGEKSGGTIALVSNKQSAPACAILLTPDEEAKLRRRSGVPYRDPALSAARQEILAARNQEMLLMESPL